MTRFIYIFLLLNVLVYTCFSQQYVSLADKKDFIEIVNNSAERLVFHNSLSGFYISESKLQNDMYTKIFISKYYPDNNIGYPELPVITKLIEIPYDADLKINILAESETAISLSEYGFDFPIVPNQPSLRKDQDPQSVKIEKNKNIYENREYYPTDLVKVEKIGVMRGVQIAQLTISPFSYDYESNELVIKNDIEVEIKFENASLIKTALIKNDKYSQAFESSCKKIWNYKESDSKDVISKYPIKYVIISDRMFEASLQDFIRWKKKKGFDVVVAYTDVIGNTTSEIKNYLQNLYNSGTIENPAPTYLLIVGDTEQVPAYQIDNHVSDMYYCEFDGGGDFIPEMYYGRFSARTVSELLPQIEKTLMYEQYTFPDPLFLRNSIFVAGNDATHGALECNGQMRYAERYYFNQEHQVNTSVYLHPESRNQSPEIISKINNGAGFVNYTAHCDYAGWGAPSFRVADVYNLTNENEYFFGIGNCCLANKFDEPECFGEALLRANKKGAVAHIGGSHNTYWNEDYYWSVGLADVITNDPTYEGTAPGTYDHLFHENGEEPYITSGQMIYAGNMSVMGSTSARKQYYWEIYHVMGDPSIMPYVGIPEQLNADHEPLIPIGMSYFTVNTEPDAYVALSNNGDIIAAGLTGSEGMFETDFNPFLEETTVDIVITKQFRIPYTAIINVALNDRANDALLRRINNPQNIIHVEEALFAPSFDIMNGGNLRLESATVGYAINNEEPVEIEWTGSINSYGTTTISFPEIELEDGVYTFAAYVDAPNGAQDENPANNRIEKTVRIYSGNVSLVEIINPKELNCNVFEIIPEIIVKNNDSRSLTSLKCSYEYGNIHSEFIWHGNINAGETQNIILPVQAIENGSYTMTVYISEPNGGTNINTFTESSINFDVKDNGYLIELDFLTDSYGHENSWALVDMISWDTIYSDGDFSQYSITHELYNWCLSSGCYKFIIFDSYGDGMKGSPIGNNPQGAVKIKNLNNNEVIFDFMGGNPDFKTVYWTIFCLDYEDIICPEETVSIDYKDNVVCLNESAPAGGVYSGDRITDGCLNPYELGMGTHEVKYSYNFNGVEKYCNFEINIDVIGIDVNKETEASIYPNPTSGLININVDVQDNFNIEIVNVFGQVVEKRSNICQNLEIDLSHLASGTYFVKIFSSTIMINEKVYILK